MSFSSFVELLFTAIEYSSISSSVKSFSEDSNSEKPTTVFKGIRIS